MKKTLAITISAFLCLSCQTVKENMAKEGFGGFAKETQEPLQATRFVGKADKEEVIPPADNRGRSDLSAYFLSTVIGFGTGHSYVGAQNAKTFLLGEAFTLLGGAVFVVAGAVMPDSLLGAVLGMIGTLCEAAFLGLKVAEIADIMGKVEVARSMGVFGE